MKLHQVAQYFNQTKFLDAYTGRELGVGQLDVYDDSKRDGLTAQRRVFEVAPGTALPARSAITFLGLPWLVGVRELDAFQGRVIREKHVVHQAEGLARLRTLRQTLEDLPALEAYAARVWTRAASQVEISSEKFNQLQIFFAQGEPLKPAMLVELSGVLHTVMEVYPAAAGHLVAVSEELEEGAIEVGTIRRQTWDPITEATVETSTPLRIVRLRWQSDFAYYSQATANFERGDMQAAALEPLANGAVLRLVDGDWTVQAAQPRNGVHYLHLRRGG